MKQYTVVLIALLNTVTSATYKLSVTSNSTLENGTLRATEELEITTLVPPVTPVTLTSLLEKNKKPEVDTKPGEDRKLEEVKPFTNDSVITTLRAIEESDTKTIDPLVAPVTLLNYLHSKTLRAIEVSETINLDPIVTPNTVTPVTSTNGPFSKTQRATKKSEATTSDPLVTTVTLTNDSLSETLLATEEPENTILETLVTPNIVEPVTSTNDPLNETLQDPEETETTTLKLLLTSTTATTVTFTNDSFETLGATKEREVTTLSSSTQTSESQDDAELVEDRKLIEVKSLTNDSVIKTLRAIEVSETMNLYPLVTPNTVPTVTSTNDPCTKTLRATKISEATTSDPPVTPVTVTNDSLTKTLLAAEESENTILETPVTPNTVKPVTSTNVLLNNLKPLVRPNTVTAVTLTNDPLNETLQDTEEPETKTTKLLVTLTTAKPVTLTNYPLNETLQDPEETETTTLKLLQISTTETPFTFTNDLVDKTLGATEERETTTLSPGTQTSESQDDAELVEDRKLIELDDDDEYLDFHMDPDLEDAIEQRDESLDSYLERIQRAELNDSSLRISEIKCKEYIFKRNEMARIDREYNLRYKAKYLVGGRVAFPFEFPHMSAIGWKTIEDKWSFKCGGTLISSKFVLTAAHCTKVSRREYPDIVDPYPKMVRIGDLHIDFKEDYSALAPSHKRTAWFQAHFDHSIDKIIVHPEFKPPKQYYDIALIELESHLVFQRDQFPACLWNRFDTSSLGMQATASGWGVIHPGPFAKPSPILQAGKLDIIDSQTCDDLLLPFCNRRHCGIAEHQICAGILAGGVDACQGDSGGPLQVRIPLKLKTFKLYYVIGVTSFGKGCARQNSPGVYTRVSSFIDWIEDIVWPK